jgi:hypothetical protein
MKPRVLLNEVTGERTPAVLLPGGLTGSVSWTPLVEALSVRRQTIRVQPIHIELGSAGERGDAGCTRGDRA